MITVQRKVQCVLWLAKFESVTLVRREYRSVFNEEPPHENNIRRWDKQLKETGSLLKQSRPGRPSVSNDTIEAVRASYLRSPKKSVRKCSSYVKVRQESVRILRASKKPKDNLSGAERKALRALRNNADLTVLPADKGSATVVLSTDDYNGKTRALLEAPTYRLLSKDPTEAVERKTNLLLKKS
ncbi:uncharacterized protein LOC110826920 [Zootermopsis nevadensis]|uniref:uncharacterized protein LOC110826920 n=1 Tax=Zootermopsis nevadensis TaxID=136037 RepID=UPI000B8E95E9|nr:uncharacterized protein LOC110826920 [Zootermopsis nevadensis]